MVSGFQTFIDAIFNPVFGWILHIPSILAIILLAVVLALLSTLLQKYLTDQARMRRLRDDSKKFQEQVKKASKDKDHDKVMKLQQKILPIQMELMKESFKPLLVSLIPFLLVFFWLSNHFAYHPIMADQAFTVSAKFEDGVSGSVLLASTPELTIDAPTQEIKDGVARWLVKGLSGTYNLTVSFPGQTIISPASRQLLITSDPMYEPPTVPNPQGHKFVKQFNVENEKLLPLPWLNLFGWHPGWIFYYIVLSIPLSLLFKKWLDVV
jgi:uncharacterized membrane protein (DUF106 family)